MYLVGNPRPTNPAGKLEAVAVKRGWPVLKFSSRSGSSPVSQLRTVAGIASLLPAAAGGLGLGLLTRNRRTGVNFFTAAWTRLLMTSIGIDLNVIGEENLTAKRPAVFLFNHRNQADPFIAGRLISDNFTSVGKKELEKDPLMGTVGRVLDAAFIDRDDPKAAVESLRKIEELARKGISVLIAPEGTRLDTTEVGEFKKGPFRIAMAAGVPLVPIVIRNAEVIAERNSSTFNPGSVDVAVFPPIPVDDWTTENLVGAHRRGPPALPRHPQGLAAGGPSRARRSTSGREPPRRRPPRRRRPRRRRPRRRRPRRPPPRKVAAKAPAKKAAAKANPAKKGTAVKVTADALHSFTPTDDALVLASVDSPAEVEMLDDWLAAPARGPPRCAHRGSPTAQRRRTAAGVSGASRRTARSRRGPVGRPRARVLDSRRAAHPLQGGVVPQRSGHLSTAEGVAAQHSSQGRRRAPGWWPASLRRCPSCARAGATPPSPRTPATSRGSSCGAPSWPSTGSSCGCSGRSTSRRG